FLFRAPCTSAIHLLSLHDALPILVQKASGEAVAIDWADVVTLEETTVVKMPFGLKDVEAYGKNGFDLQIQLKSGETVTVQNFFVDFDEDEEEKNELVLEDDDGLVYIGQFDAATGHFTFTPVGSAAEATAAGLTAKGLAPWAALAVIALLIGSHSSSSSSGSGKAKAEQAAKDALDEAKDAVKDAEQALEDAKEDDKITEDEIAELEDDIKDAEQKLDDAKDKG